MHMGHVVPRLTNQLQERAAGVGAIHGSRYTRRWPEHSTSKIPIVFPTNSMRFRNDKVLVLLCKCYTFEPHCSRDQSAANVR